MVLIKLSVKNNALTSYYKQKLFQAGFPENIKKTSNPEKIAP